LSCIPGQRPSNHAEWTQRRCGNNGLEPLHKRVNFIGATLAFDADHDFALRLPLFNQRVGIVDRVQVELARIQQRLDHARFCQASSFAQDLAVMSLAFNGQQRLQGEHPAISCCTERKWCQRVRAPAQRTDHVSEPCHCLERRIQPGPTRGVIRHVETTAGRMGSNLVLDRHLLMVNRRRAELLADVGTYTRIGREDGGAKTTRNLDRHAANAAGAALHQHGLVYAHMRTMHQGFHAVLKTSGNEAASRMQKWAGFNASRLVSTAAYSASEPCAPRTPPGHAIDLIAHPKGRDTGPATVTTSVRSMPRMAGNG
jgi:hypothetical protein